ncbi:MAG: alpha/beta hydrolase [Bacteroidales bacterium]|nr:alpha/beta hydrolase [Bacteroidales bacterium]
MIFGLKKGKLLALLAVAFVFHNHAIAQTGWWTAWSQQTGLALCMHIAPSSTPELYSPMQSKLPIQVTDYSRQGDTLRIVCGGIGLRATLVYGSADSSWHGRWRQGVMREEVVFAPADTLFTLRRPQTPQVPYSFVEREVEVDYTDSEGNRVHMSGVVALPSTKGKYPLVMLVSGSGQQNRDCELLGHHPFLVLTDYLTRHGVAVGRFDDRGIGRSTGNLDRATTALFAEDAEAMWRAMLKVKGVDRKRSGIVGHSEGAVIAAMLAAKRNDVHLLVMLGGQGCSGREVMVQQNRAIYAAMGMDSSAVDARTTCIDSLMQMPPTASVKAFQATMQRLTAHLDEPTKAKIGMRKADAYALRNQLQMPWMQAFINIDMARILPNVKCRTLAITGELDLQVPPDPNLKMIDSLTTHRAMCIQMPHLNHLMQHCQSGLPQEYATIEETFATEAMQAIADFVLQE